MKKLVLIMQLFIFGFSSVLVAQQGTQGVYLTADDFKSNKISYANNQSNEKYKLHLNEFFNSPTIKIIKGDKIIKLKKDSIFGYHDKNNQSIRFYNKEEYTIINSSDNILMYIKSSVEGDLKNRHLVTKYYFSVDANSPIYPLTKHNLKTSYYNNASFLKLMDVYFYNDNDLITYDYQSKSYNLNRIYTNSKLVSNK